MEQLIWFGFVILGLVLAGLVHVGIPIYLANKTIKVLFPSLRAESRLFQERWWDHVVSMGLMVMVLIPLVLLLLHLGVDSSLQIPRWAPWVPEGLHRLYHEFMFPIPIAMFIARFATVVLFAWRLQKKKRK